MKHETLYLHLPDKPYGEDVAAIGISVLRGVTIVLCHSLHDGKAQARRALARGARIEAVKNMIAIERLSALIAHNKASLAERDIHNATLGAMHKGILHKIDNERAQQRLINI